MLPIVSPISRQLALSPRLLSSTLQSISTIRRASIRSFALSAIAMAESQKEQPLKAVYRQLGRSGLRVSVPIIGAMSFGDKRWQGWVIEEAEVRLHRSLPGTISSNEETDSDLYRHFRYSKQHTTGASIPGTQPTSTATATRNASLAKLSRNTRFRDKS